MTTTLTQTTTIRVNGGLNPLANDINMEVELRGFIEAFQVHVHGSHTMLIPKPSRPRQEINELHSMAFHRGCEEKKKDCMDLSGLRESILDGPQHFSLQWCACD